MVSEGSLRAEGVGYRYGGNPVLCDVTLELRTGEMLALAGPNGSGKTTFLRILSGILPPLTGGVTLDGVDLRRTDSRRRARRIAVVPQHLDPRLAFTVRELVAMGRAPYIPLMGGESGEDRNAAERALAATDTLHLAERTFADLSGGEQQRAVLALALAQETDFLLLDEPTVHLDLQHQHELLELLARLRKARGLGILAILHDLNLASLFFDRLAVMQGGSLALLGTPDEILPREDLGQIFGAPLLVVTHPHTQAPQVLLDRLGESP